MTHRMGEGNMAEILVLQHVSCEPLGTIEDALHGAGLSPRYVRVQDGEPVPQGLGDAAGLIILGGSMGAYEEARYPFLTDEKRLISQAAAQDLPILGVCLGGQLLAAALGASVRQGAHKEIGWYPVTLTAEAADDALWHDIGSPFTGFHWHSDFFETPTGAVSLASSALTPCQAFRFGKHAYGFQCHLEVTETIVRDWTVAFVGELAEAGLDATSITASIADNLPAMQQVAQEVFGHWAVLAAERVHGKGASVGSR